MKVTCISDTHAQHEELDLDGGDLLIHTGDLTEYGTPAETEHFLTWFESQPFEYKVFIAGNHDFEFEHIDSYKVPAGVYYLQNSGVTLAGLNFWGSPYTLSSFGMAFELSPAQIATVWNQIPSGLDFLMTHLPPYGILDRQGNEYWGCPTLLETVLERKPKYHIFGHAHQGYGCLEKHGIQFLNVARGAVSFEI